MNAVMEQEHAPIVTPAFLQDPYPVYAHLRQEHPVQWSDEFFQGAWLVSRHADVEPALRDPRLSAQRTGGWVNEVEGADDADSRLAQRAFQRFFARALLFLDAPDHPRLRKVMMPAFRQDRLLRLQPLLEEWCTELACGLQGQFDFMERIARPLPARVISHLMGVDASLELDFMQWAEGLAAFIGAARPTARQLAVAQGCLTEMLRYFEEDLLPRRRLVPRDDLVGTLLAAEADGTIQSHGELLAQCAMLLFAGYETTRNLLGNGMHAFMTHRDQWQALCANPSLAPQAVRELLRYDSPVQWTGRRAATSFEWHGQQIRRGDLIILLIGSANRDPARHEAPDRLDVQRIQPGALSFGSGPHVCIGAGLTQLEAQAMFSALARQCPDLLPDGPPLRDGNPVYRGVRQLPMQRAVA